MVRIVWGVIFILFGLFLFIQSLMALAMLQLGNQIISGAAVITPLMLQQSNILSNSLFSFAFCLSGSLMIYFGSQSRSIPVSNHPEELEPTSFNKPNQPDW